MQKTHFKELGLSLDPRDALKIDPDLWTCLTPEGGPVRIYYRELPEEVSGVGPAYAYLHIVQPSEWAE
jgi:hypothetical protein